jgi:hypothetical protein
MPPSLAQLVAIHSDTLLSLAACLIFARPQLRKHYPWMFTYLCVRAVTVGAVDFLRFGPLFASPEAYTKVHFVVSWAGGLASSVLLFMGCLDVYRQAMAPLQGLARMGTTIFRWAAFASLLVTATTLTSIGSGPHILMKVGLQLMRCMSTAELCLLALLVLSLNAIGLSARSRPFGIAMGLGLMAIIDCAQSITASMAVGSSIALQIVFACATLASLGLWIAYSALPDPTRKTITVRADSAIFKWDQIASALGHKGTQVALQPAPSFFLVDVEKVVERAFVRTLKGKESES